MVTGFKLTKNERLEKRALNLMAERDGLMERCNTIATECQTIESRGKYLQRRLVAIERRAEIARKLLIGSLLGNLALIAALTYALLR